MLPLGDESEVATYTPEQKTALIRAGDATLKSSATGYTYFRDAFDYPLNAEQTAQQAVHDAWQAKVDAITAEANAIEASLVDELVMSPDGVGALKRIAEAFSA